MRCGLNGVNLYEMWLYRRMTDRGYPMTRGSGEAIIRSMSEEMKQWSSAHKGASGKSPNET